MGKKIIKKRANTSEEVPDSMLEEVEEGRALELEEDEETNEVIFVCHYRRKWGDDFDADVEHGFDIEQAAHLAISILQIIDNIKNRMLIVKSTLAPIEGNPMQGPRVADIPPEVGGK